MNDAKLREYESLARDFRLGHFGHRDVFLTTADAIDALVAEVRRMAATIDRLPQTADGAVAVPLQFLWATTGNRYVANDFYAATFDEPFDKLQVRRVGDWGQVRIAELYSIPEAAQAAAGDAGEVADGK